MTIANKVGCSGKKLVNLWNNCLSWLLGDYLFIKIIIPEICGASEYMHC